MNMSSSNDIKNQIIQALSHPEADEGLYFRNLYNLHEEDERKAVNGTQEEILEALKELLDEGKVLASDEGPEMVFRLPQ